MFKQIIHFGQDIDMSKILLSLLSLFFVASICFGTEVKITASDAQAGDTFGRSVSISGDYAIVGAYMEDAGGGDAGAAYIFDRNQGGTDNWGEVTKLTASDAQLHHFFGFSVSISGDYAMVGASDDDVGGSGAGAAYSFLRSGFTWNQQCKIMASDAQSGDAFGTVSISDNYAIIGAYDEDSGGSTAGAAYIYESIADLALPVELTSFTATARDKQVTLKWATASEVNNQGFVILRASEKDSQYTEISSFKYNDDLIGAGTSPTQHDYNFVDKYVFNGHTYWYKLIDVNISGIRTEHGPISVKVPLMPIEFKLFQNYPNPFNPSTSIEFTLPKANDVRVEVFNIAGQNIETLLNKSMPAGYHEVEFNAQNLSSGIYFYKIQAGKFQDVKKMILIK